MCSTRAIRGVPIFPARIVENPAFFKMCSIKEVVVVFPFEPVIPIKRPLKNRSASSTSLQMVTPFARAACSKGASAGTPGLGTIRSCSRNVFSRWPPNSSFTPAARSGAIASPISLSVRASDRAPRGAKERSSHTGPCQSHDQHAFTSQFERVRHLFRKNPLTRMRHYLSFNVVSANSAKTSAAIQNRTMTFDSLHPSSSKW